MQAAGFVLVGGNSRRMGRDKALLPWHSGVLVEHIATRLGSVLKEVTLVGDPSRYAHLPLPCLPDLRPGLGSLAGIETALLASLAEWNLIVACDMPDLADHHLTRLLERAGQSGAKCLVTIDASGAIHPLCAMYRKTCLPVIQRALDAKSLRLMPVIEELHAEFVHSPAPIPNVNTPEEWEAVRSKHVY